MENPQVYRTFEEWWESGFSTETLTDDTLLVVQLDGEDHLKIAKAEAVKDYIKDSITASTGGGDQINLHDVSKAGIFIRGILKEVIHDTDLDVPFEFDIDDTTDAIVLKFNPAQLSINDLMGNLATDKIYDETIGDTLENIIADLMKTRVISVEFSSGGVIKTGELEVGSGWEDNEITVEITNNGTEDLIVYGDSLVLPLGIRRVADTNITISPSATESMNLDVNIGQIRTIDGIISLGSNAHYGNGILRVTYNIIPAISVDDRIVFLASTEFLPEAAFDDADNNMVVTDSTDATGLDYGYEESTNRMKAVYGWGGIPDHKKYHWIIYKKSRGKLTSIAMTSGGFGQPADYPWLDRAWEVELTIPPPGVGDPVTQLCYAYRTQNQIVNFGNFNSRNILFYL